jgi:hypothetical protein
MDRPGGWDATILGRCPTHPGPGWFQPENAPFVSSQAFFSLLVRVS